MLTPTDFKNGLTIKWKHGLWQVVEFLHVKPGKGAAFVRAKLKNITTKNTVEDTFRMNEQFEAAHIEKKEMQYLYAAGENFAFMDLKSYEQLELTTEQLGKDVLDFLKEETVCMVTFCDGQILGVELPNSLTLEVKETAPNEKGNTSSGGTKPAILETGATVNVPFFVETGEKIRVNPITREYQDRAK